LTLESIPTFTLLAVDDNYSGRGFLLPGELAVAAGVSTDTLRHYERKGVLPRPLRSANGYRQYPKASLDRIRLVRSSLAVGFTLDELAAIFAERDKGGAPCRKVHGLAVEKLAELEEQIKALVELRKRLREVVTDWEEKLAASPNGEKVGLLQSLPRQISNGNRRVMKLSPNLKRRKTERKK
jgi:DNA-binding transcriptional MerR regulator